MSNWREIAKGVVFWVSLAVLIGALGFAFYYDRSGGAARPERSAPSPAAAPTGAPLAGEPLPPSGGAHAAPFEALQNASTGDWRAYTHRTKSSFGDLRSTAIMWVERAGADEVTVGVHGRLENTGEERTGRDETYPREGLTIERLVGHDIGGWTILDAAISDDTYTIGERAFACKKITFTSRDPMFPSKQTTTELWLSPEVAVDGVVASRELQILGDQQFLLTDELIGYGTAGETTWGTRPELVID